MTAKIYDLFIEDAVTGELVPNVRHEEEFWVVSDAGAEATFATMGEAAGFYCVQEPNPTRRVMRVAASGPVERAA